MSAWLSEWLIWFSWGLLVLAPGLVGFMLGRWWWPFAWIFVGVGLLSLSLYVHMSHLPDPVPHWNDGGTSYWAIVLLSYRGAVVIGVGAAALGVAIRRNRRRGETVGGTDRGR